MTNAEKPTFHCLPASAAACIALSAPIWAVLMAAICAEVSDAI